MASQADPPWQARLLETAVRKKICSCPTSAAAADLIGPSLPLTEYKEELFIAAELMGRTPYNMTYMEINDLLVSMGVTPRPNSFLFQWAQWRKQQ